MEVVEQGICSLWGANQIFHIPLNSLYGHLNGCIQNRKMGPPGVLIENKDVVVYEWILTMGEYGLSISLSNLS
jgi:hypothetical protein